MENLDDIALLRYCGTSRTEEAFSILVHRHINLVYSAAIRQVRDPHLAKDVSQSVFVLLAKKAREIKPGTILSGWLHRATRNVASETLRSETRRRIREHAAMEPLAEPPGRSPWEEVEPLLDEAVAALNESDRDLVLLRYFENKSLKEVGARFGISEDAAQKRVTRALDKLRTLFAERGSTISAATLATLISTSAVQAAPAGVPAVVLTAAVPATAAATAITIQPLIEFMTMTKMKAGIAAVVLATTVTVPLVTQQRALKEVRQQNESLRSELQEIKSSPEAPSGRGSIAPAEMARLRSDAAEVHRLRAEVTMLRDAGRSHSSSSTPQGRNGMDPAQAADPMGRLNQGRDLMAQGQYAEALEHFLWCFDEGGKTPAFVGVRSSFLLNDLRELSKVYPPARQAMIDRRDAAERALVDGDVDPRATLEYHQLNEHLGQPGQTMALFDQLPSGHPARSGLVDVAPEQFLTTRRYGDMVEAGNPEANFDQARFTFDSLQEHEATQDNQQLHASMRRRAVQSGARGVEALAGAGQISRALALAESVLSFDPSPETRGQLLKHAERAGQPQVTAYIQTYAPAHN